MRIAQPFPEQSLSSLSFVFVEMCQGSRVPRKQTPTETLLSMFRTPVRTIIHKRHILGPILWIHLLGRFGALYSEGCDSNVGPPDAGQPPSPRQVVLSELHLSLQNATRDRARHAPSTRSLLPGARLQVRLHNVQAGVEDAAPRPVEYPFDITRDLVDFASAFAGKPGESWARNWSYPDDKWSKPPQLGSKTAQNCPSKTRYD